MRDLSMDSVEKNEKGVCRSGDTFLLLCEKSLYYPDPQSETRKVVCEATAFGIISPK